MIGATGARRSGRDRAFSAYIQQQSRRCSVSGRCGSLRLTCIGILDAAVLDTSRPTSEWTVRIRAVEKGVSFGRVSRSLWQSRSHRVRGASPSTAASSSSCFRIGRFNQSAREFGGGTCFAPSYECLGRGRHAGDGAGLEDPRRSRDSSPATQMKLVVLLLGMDRG